VRISINEHEAQLKVLSLDALHKVAEALGAAFLPHVPAAMQLLCADGPACANGLGLLGFKYHDDVRRYAAYASFELFKCAALALRAGKTGAQEVQALFEATLQRLVGALRSESSTAVAVSMAVAIKVRVGLFDRGGERGSLTALVAGALWVAWVPGAL
jgi:hypothetical protein